MAKVAVDKVGRETRCGIVTYHESQYEAGYDLLKILKNVDAFWRIFGIFTVCKI